MLMFFQEFSGINCILFYCAYIFQLAGIGLKRFKPEDLVNPDTVMTAIRNNAKLCALFVSGTLFVFTGISCFLVDRFGRRKLFLFGSAMMSLALLYDGIYSYEFQFFNDDIENYLLTASDVPSKLALFSTLFFIAAFSIGWGPLPWLLMSELFPIKTQGVATSIVTSANWLFVFVTTSSFCLVVESVKPYGAFWTFTGVTVLGFFFVLFFLPETGGRPLEDVSELFIRRRIVHVSIPWIRYDSL